MPNSQTDWHLPEWLAHFNKKQADLVRDLDWNKARANFLFHGKQQYKRDDINEISGWLGIEPYELLMPPSEALALRQLRTTAAEIVAAGDRFLPAEIAPTARRRNSAA